MVDTHYIHGTTPDEQDRLALMNTLLNGRELARIPLTGNERCLELGAGTGLFARDLAAVLDGGSVLAIERDARQLAAAQQALADSPTVELRAGDVLAPPLEDDEWAGFDLVHARFLLEHLPDPRRAVAVMARAVRPGGRVVLVDDDHSVLRLAPTCEPFEALWTVYWQAYEALGCDPNVGRRLPTLARAAGLLPTRTDWVPYGGCAGEQHFPGIVDNLVRVVDSARDTLLERGLRDAARFDSERDALRAWAEQPDAVVWYGLPLLEARRPGSDGPAS